MTKSRVLTAGLVASALLLVPVSSALADGPRGSKGASHHGSSYHGGGYRGPVWHGAGYRAPYAYGGGGYWRGGVWWPFAAVGAVVGTAAAIVAAPFVAFGNAVASAPYYAPQQQYYAPQSYVVPQQQYYAPQQQYYAPQGYDAPRPTYAPQQTYSAPQGYNTQPSYGDATPPPDYSTQAAPPQYYNNNARPPQGYAPQQQRSYAPPATYNAPPNYPPANTTYQRQPDPEYYSYNYPR
jgi:hypothetical protein